MIAAISFTESECTKYVLTENAEAILADDDAIFVDDMDSLKIELAVRHPVPSGFTNLDEGRSHGVYLNDGKLTSEYWDGDRETNQQVNGEMIVVSDTLTAVTADRKTIEDVATETGKIIDVLHDEEWVEESWEGSNFSVFPSGDFLVRTLYRGRCSVEYSPSKAKGLMTKRKNAAANRINKGEPAVKDLTKLIEAGHEISKQHPLFASESISFTHKVIESGTAPNRRGSYYSIVSMFDAINILFGEDRQFENEKFKELIEEFLPYRESFNKMQTKEVPEPTWDDDDQHRSEYSANNRTQISKINKHNDSIEPAKKFSSWLTTQAIGCGLE